MSRQRLTASLQTVMLNPPEADEASEEGEILRGVYPERSRRTQNDIVEDGAFILICKTNGRESEKKKGEHPPEADSPLQGDFARKLMISRRTGQMDAHEVGADLRVCPIDAFCELSKMRLGVLKIRLWRADI